MGEEELHRYVLAALFVLTVAAGIVLILLNNGA